MPPQKHFSIPCSRLRSANEAGPYREIAVTAPQEADIDTLKPAIILFSGWMARAENYKYLAEFLGQRYVVLQPELGDWLGYADDIRSDEYLIKDLVEVLEPVRLKNDGECQRNKVVWTEYVVVGHSRGGKLAALFYGYSNCCKDRTEFANFTSIKWDGRLDEANFNKLLTLGPIRACCLIDPINDSWWFRPFNKADGQNKDWSEGNLNAIDLWKEGFSSKWQVGIVGAKFELDSAADLAPEAQGPFASHFEKIKDSLGAKEKEFLDQNKLEHSLLSMHPQGHIYKDFHKAGKSEKVLKVIATHHLGFCGNTNTHSLVNFFRDQLTNAIGRERKEKSESPCLDQQKVLDETKDFVLKYIEGICTKPRRS